MVNREEGLKFLQENIKNRNIIKHLLAVEAIMRVLARRFEPENEEVWAMAGLLHDGDYTPETPMSQQGIKVSRLLEEKGYQVPEEMKQAMAAHNWHGTSVEPKSKMDWSLFISDSLTGLIVATVLVHPEKKISEISADSVLKKFKDGAFAKGTRREDIALCEKMLGIPLQEFVEIGLKAMKEISLELGL